ncbi:molecular chaperone TorD family protein [Paeniroseomonas aquatica]|uniref:molecular chaperone TorD family protein n=1 Tax=Paeniroseomonas aquatica TaxID=373043 RepID=UPI00360E9366
MRRCWPAWPPCAATTRPWARPSGGWPRRPPAPMRRRRHASISPSSSASAGEVLAYASYYLTGFLHERPLAELRGTLARLGIVRAEGMAEPEDQLGFAAR